MIVRILTLAAALAAMMGAGAAQHRPYAGMQERPVKALSADEIADLRAGRGMGFALAAELNGYPGPVHVLEHADALGLSPDHALIDGNVRPDMPCPATLIVEGDGKSFSIAAASIVAKVVRDRLMRAMSAYHPEYGWDHNSGYSTPEHLSALARFGPCLQHRRSFYSVRKNLLARA